LGIDLIWFGVLLGVNMQTSFMHPPFGFALFYLRSVAPSQEYTDKLTKKLIAPVTTMQIYWGAIPFVIIQIVMVGLIITFPAIVSSGLDKTEKIDLDKVVLEVQAEAPAEAASAPMDGASAPVDETRNNDDPMKAMEESMKKKP
jgi:GntP family gluconate:H+ symporter